VWVAVTVAGAGAVTEAVAVVGTRALPAWAKTANRNNAFRAGNWSAIGNTLTLLEVTDGKSARCCHVCRPPVLAKNAVGREAVSEYKVIRKLMKHVQVRC